MRYLLFAVILLTAACQNDSTPPPDTTVRGDGTATSPGLRAEDLLPEEFERLWQPWTGDLDAIVERRVLRVLLPYGGYQFYYERGRPRGATWEMLSRLESYLNDEYERRHVRIFVMPVPVSRDHLVPGLLDGSGDLIAADLTITPEREALVAFTRPLLTDIHEVVVLGPNAPEINTLDDLAGKSIFVRASSSYAEHLKDLTPYFEEKGLEPPVVLPADEILESEDLLEMLQIGVADITIMDQYKAEFWAQIMDTIVVRPDLVIHEGGEIAWAHRKDDQQLATLLENFLRKYGKGSAFGNDVYNRYLGSAERIRCSSTPGTQASLLALAELFQLYGDKYEFDWLMLAAQGYQESGLRQDRKSSAGAVGVMQIKPSTAADKNVGIPDISTAENNIHAGTKYLRFIADRYFDKAHINPIDQWLFSLAAYNAGPARINRHRKEAAEKGYNPNEWFDNVEIIAAKRIGRETVTYVSNIYKYFIGYQLSMSRYNEIEKRYGELLPACGND